MGEGRTIHAIRTAVANRQLPSVFSPADVNRVLQIKFAGVFLPKHRVGNPGGNTELFVRIGGEGSPARYRLKSGATREATLVAVWDGNPTRSAIEHDIIYDEV